jgi:hypothetical protein
VTQKKIIDILSGWLLERGFKQQPGNWKNKLIFERDREVWVIEIISMESEIDMAIGRLIREMYRETGNKFFLATPSTDCIEDYIFDLGIGMIVVANDSVTVIDPTKSPRYIHGFRSKEPKKERIRIRCSELTKRYFYALVEQGNFKTLEDALIYLLRKGGIGITSEYKGLIVK